MQCDLKAWKSKRVSAVIRSPSCCTTNMSKYFGGNWILRPLQIVPRSRGNGAIASTTRLDNTQRLLSLHSVENIGTILDHGVSVYDDEFLPCVIDVHDKTIKQTQTQ